MNKNELIAPKVLRDWFEQSEDTTFWGQKCRVDPALVHTVLGDGGKLAFITPMMTRPNYYGILVDSSWTEDDLGEHSERLIQAIEESYGNSKENTDENGEPEADSEWPAYHDGGHSWGFIKEIPKDVLDATRADIASQMKDQDALFIGPERVKPGNLLKHPEFGDVQARYNECLGWHYCRPGDLHTFDDESFGYATDFNGVTMPVDEFGSPGWHNWGIYNNYSNPKDAKPNAKQAGKNAAQTFPKVLESTERAHAHQVLSELLRIPDDASDEAALAYVQKDPSLFIEPIPKSNPLDPEMNSVWTDRSNWYGNWLSRAADNGFPKTVGALLALGVHPDDQSAFMLRPLIHCVEWYSKPERLALALSCGAAPDSPSQVERAGGFRANPNNSLLRTCLQYVSRAMFRYSQGLGHVAIFAKSAELLLTAGARVIDPGTHDVLFDDGTIYEEAKKAETGIGMLVGRLRHLKDDASTRDLVHGLLRKLHAAGADLSRPSDSDQIPPVISVIRDQDIATFSLLVELGANVKDADLVVKNPYAYGYVRPLLDEAAEVGGQAFKAEVTEVLMRHVVASKVSLPPLTAPALRRRVRAV